jgi:hypothetical protein
VPHTAANSVSAVRCNSLGKCKTDVKRPRLLPCVLVGVWELSGAVIGRLVVRWPQRSCTLLRNLVVSSSRCARQRRSSITNVISELPCSRLDGGLSIRFSTYPDALDPCLVEKGDRLGRNGDGRASFWNPSNVDLRVTLQLDCIWHGKT